MKKREIREKLIESLEEEGVEYDSDSILEYDAIMAVECLLGVTINQCVCGDSDYYVITARIEIKPKVKVDVVIKQDDDLMDFSCNNDTTLDNMVEEALDIQREKLIMERKINKK